MTLVENGCYLNIWYSLMAYGVELWGWVEKGKLEKIMLDYIRWIFKLDFYTPRYVIMRELVMDKFKVGGLRIEKD